MTRRSLRPTAILVALLAVALPASADAAVRLPDPYKGNDQAPTIDLAGERIVATETLSDDVATLLSPRRVGVFAAPLSGPGGWRLIHKETLRTRRGASFEAFEATASASRLALSREAIGEEAAGFFGLGASLRAGALGGSLTSLLSCPKSNLLPTPAVDGLLVAYAGCTSSTVTVRDPRQPASSARGFSFGNSVSQLALAGRYLAVLLGGEDEEEERADGEVVLIDHTTRRIVLRAPFPRAEGLAVQGDGTVAVSLRVDDSAKPPACRGSRVAWFSPDRPSPQSLPEAACISRIRIGGDRIAYLAGRPDDERLVLAKLDGTPGRTVARSVQGRRFALRGFDWDGARVAYGEDRCLDPATVVAGPEEPTQTFGPLQCPIEILSDSARLARDNSVGIRVRCANGCDGEIAFYKPGYLHYNLTPGRFVRFRGAPGKIQTVRIRLSRKQGARVRRERTVPARVKAISPYAFLVKALTLRAGP